MEQIFIKFEGNTQEDRNKIYNDLDNLDKWTENSRVIILAIFNSN